MGAISGEASSLMNGMMGEVSGLEGQAEDMINGAVGQLQGLVSLGQIDHAAELLRERQLRSFFISSKTWLWVEIIHVALTISFDLK